MKYMLPFLVVAALLAAVFVRPPHIFLALGLLSVAAATVFAIKGKVWVRFNGWVYRAEKPETFWWEVAIDYLVGAFFIGYFLYKAYGL